MKYDSIIVRYGEIFLKGKNRGHFEKKLLQNLKSITNIKEIQRIRMRYLLPFFEDHHKIKHVFGTTSYSPALKVEKSLNIIKQKALELLQDHKGSFKINTKRSDKRFPGTSPQINVEVGKFVEENSDATFQFNDPDLTLHIEINQEATYLFTKVIKCHGGLPTGVEGKVLLLIENEFDLLAGLLFMKRGTTVFPVAFKDVDVSLLQLYSPIPMQLTVVSGIQEVEQFAAKQRIEVLVTGQTLETYQKLETNLATLRPLIGFTKKQVEQLQQHFNLQ